VITLVALFLVPILWSLPQGTLKQRESRGRMHSSRMR
jgi:hypothetical protein